MNGTVERAQLVASVDQLLEWQKGFSVKQVELIKWQTMVMTDAIEIRKSMQNMLDGLTKMMEIDTELSKRIDILSERVDIVNKRLRKLEEAK